MTLSPDQVDSLLRTYFREKRTQELSKEVQYRDLSLVHDKAADEIADILLDKIIKEKNSLN
jgi:hypothetical protein